MKSDEIYLIDTHYLIWDMMAHHSFTDYVENLLVENVGKCFYSTISYWEMAMLISKGRLEIHVSISQFFHDLEKKRNIRPLNLTPEIGDLVRQFVNEINGDPADRIIVATALHHKAILVTADENLKSLSFVETIK